MFDPNHWLEKFLKCESSNDVSELIAEFEREHSTTDDKQESDLMVQLFAFGLEAHTHIESSRDARDLENEFVAKVSHELRTPLSGIVGLLDLLADSRLSSEQSEMISLAQSSASTLTSIIEDLLVFSKVAPLDHERIVECDLRETVREVLELLKYKAVPQRTTLNWASTPHFPDNVKAPLHRVRQILFNLVSNAVKFTADGAVSVMLDYSDGTVHLRVTDDGIGIAEEKLEAIFRPFEQVARLASSSGVGLGLAITREIVEQLQGTIRAESTVGVGTTFHVEFPAETTKRRVTIATSSDELARFWERTLSATDFSLHRIRSVEELTIQDRVLVCDAEGDGPLFWNSARDRRIVVIGENAQRPRSSVALENTFSADEFIDATFSRNTKTILIVSNDESQQSKLLSAIRSPTIRVEIADDSQAVEIEEYDWVIGDFDEAAPGLIPSSLEVSTIAEIVSELGSTNGKRVLVVDDDPVNRRIAVKYAEQLGLETSSVSNGREAIEFALNQSVDLILMDCNMPVLDGFEATRTLRQRGLSTPIVALSALVQETEQEKMLNAGMNGFIGKPIKQEIFRDIVQRWLSASDDYLDVSHLNQFIDEMRDEAFVHELVTMFQNDVFESWENSKGDHATISKFLHTTKSSARTFGLMRLGNLCESYEDIDLRNAGWDESFETVLKLSIAELVAFFS